MTIITMAERLASGGVNRLSCRPLASDLREASSISLRTYWKKKWIVVVRLGQLKCQNGLLLPE
jgi:hypothetical protein